MRRLLASILFLILAFTPFLLGQARTGNIYGKVVDAATGQPLPGVAVTLTGEGIAPMTAITTAQGNFRFLRLPPGVYNIKAELQGFKALERRGIRVLVGSNVTLTLKLEQGTIQEEITVTASAPAVDTKKATVSANVTKEALQELPTSRDPWAILDLTPGVMTDRANIGGSESGQQPYFFARGGTTWDAQWNIDGLTVTDPSSLSSPVYYDYDSFEEMSISTAANDVTAPTGGIMINFVTKRGGNKLSGGGRVFYTTDKFEDTNVEGVDLINPNYKGNRLKHLYDYGADLGGPLIKDKLWFWAAYGTQDIHNTDITGEKPDNTLLRQVNAKINAQLGHHRLEFYFNYADKIKEGRGAGAFRPHETTYKQTGPTYIYKFQDDFTIGQNFFGSLKLGYVDGGFSMEPYGGRDTYAIWDYGGWFGTAGMWHQTYYYYITDRKQYQATFVGNYFIEGLIGATHEIKFGAEYRGAPITSMSNYGYGMVVYTYPSSWWWTPYPTGSVWLIRTSYQNIGKYRASAFIQDSITTGRLTLNLGLRYDRQWLKKLETTVPGNPITEEAYEKGLTSINYLPEARQKEEKLPFTWNMVSPRVSLVYDLTGKGKTVVKASFSLYGSILGVGPASDLSATPWREADFYWYDYNKNGIPEINEIDWAYGPIWWNYNISNPNEVVNKIGSDFRVPKTLEFTAGLQHELITDLAVGLNLYYRKIYDDYWGDYPEITHDDWYIAGYIPEEYGGYAYWACSKPKPAGYVLTKVPDWWQDYKGIEIIINKRLSNKWMLNSSITLQDWRQHYDSPAAYHDPTNHEPIDLLNNRPMAIESRGSGLGNVYPNSRWMFKLSGLYQLPYGFNVSATMIAREGYIAPVYYTAQRPSNGWGSTVGVYIKPFGEERLPNFFLINAKLEKLVNLKKYGKIYLSIEGFNLTNSNTILAENFDASQATFRKVTQILNPRIFRFGVRFTF